MTQTIALAPTQVPSTCVHKEEPSGNETQSSDSESNLYCDYIPESTVNLVDDQQMQVDDVQLGDGEMGRVGYDAMGEGVGDGDEGDYGNHDLGMGYGEHMSDGASPLVSFSGDHANWPGDVGYDQHMHYPSAGGGAHYHAAADEDLPSPHLQVPKNPGFHKSKDHHAIPLDLDAIVNYFDTPSKPKRGCGSSRLCGGQTEKSQSSICLT